MKKTVLEFALTVSRLSLGALRKSPGAGVRLQRNPSSGPALQLARLDATALPPNGADTRRPARRRDPATGTPGRRRCC